MPQRACPRAAIVRYRLVSIMKQEQTIVLSPVQQQAYQGLLAGAGTAGVLLLKARPRSGRTTILRKLHQALGGAFLAAPVRSSGLVEEIFLRKIEQALAAHRVVIVDDLHVVSRAADAGGPARGLLLDAALTAIVGEAGALHKRLVFGTDAKAPWPLVRRALTWEVGA